MSERTKAPFSIQKRPANRKELEKKRQQKKWKAMYYVQFRDPDGNFTTAVSSGQTSKGAAINRATEYL